MKIIHCLNQYMPQAMAGTEIYTHTLATLQKRSGNEVAVITPHIDYYRPGQINEHYIYDEIDVYQFLEEADPTDRHVQYGNKKPKGLNNFVSLLKQLTPDVINFHELNRSIGFTIEHVKLAKQFGAKVFLTMHLPFYSCNTNVLVYNNELCDGVIRNFECSECTYKTLFNVPPIFSKTMAMISISTQKSLITEKLPPGSVTTLLSVSSTISRIRNDLRELWNNVDQMISLNKWYKKILIKNGVPEDKITVVGPALVTNRKNVAPKIRRDSSLPLKMVFVGRIQPLKGIHLIIEAMKSFTTKQVLIDIYGKQEETPYYKKCITNSMNVATIKFRGELKRKDVVNTLAQYDMFCLASTFSEMSPLVIQEAFAAGIPILASKVYGNMEQIEDNQNGLLFEFNSSTALKKQIQSLVDNPGLLQKLKNNILVPKSFNIVNEQYLWLYGTA